MPELSAFEDVEELDNRYSAKCVVYVEGEDDRNVWERVIGNDLGDRLEFKVPTAGGAGSGVVLNRVRGERARNSKIYGLVDGEVSASLNQVTRLIECSDVLFMVDGTDCDGIIFLGSYELENVLVCHAKVPEFVEYNVKVKHLGSREKEEIEVELARLARRFYVAALLKFASAQLYSRGGGTGILNVDRFRSDCSLAREVRRVKEEVRSEAVDGGLAFRRQLAAIGDVAKRKMERVEGEGGSRKEEMARLADGKGLLVKVHQRWGFPASSEGLLVERVCAAPFAERFRTELLALTNA